VRVSTDEKRTQLAGRQFKMERNGRGERRDERNEE